MSVVNPCLKDSPTSRSRAARSQEIFPSGARAWTKGFVRAERKRALQDTALELLVLESGGEALDADTFSRVTRDPLSGQPFVFDVTERTLSLPASGDHETASLKLP